MELIVLDMDDTLYLERDYVRSGFMAVGEYVAAAYGVETGEWMWEQFEAGVRGDTFNRLANQFGLPADVVPELVATYRNHAPDIRLEPDAQAFLERWRGEVPLALITDGYGPGQRQKIAALGLEDYFEDLIVTGERGEGWPKPGTRAFTYLQEKHGVSAASECIYIGDNPHKDFVGPDALGWAWQRILRPGSLHEAVPTPAGGVTVTELGEV